MLRLDALKERLRLSLWFVPALFALAAVVLAIALLFLDTNLSRDPDLLFFYSGTAEGARGMLSTIAQSMLTFTGLVFSITMLVLQLASSQLSPRVMRTFLRDRANQSVLGLFVATFLYTLIVLRQVRSPLEGGDGFVPGVSIWVAFLLLIASVAAFIYYIDHMAHAIRASTVIARIADETREAIERLFPDRLGEEVHPEAAADWPNKPDLVLRMERGAVLVGVDEERLLTAIDRDDRRAELPRAIGDFVPAGAPLVRLWGTWDGPASDEVRAAIGTDGERTLAQDASFGFRQLVDVALRALSPGTNDPTTATQTLDQLHDLLRSLAERDIPSPVRRGKSGAVRLRLGRPGWEDYVDLATDEIRLAAVGQIAVMRRLRELFRDVLTVAPEPRQAVLRRKLALLDAELDRQFPDEEDRATASTASARGHALATSDPDEAPG